MTADTSTPSLLESVRAKRYRCTSDEVAEYHREGYLLLRGLLSPSEAEALRDEVMGIMEVIGLGRTKLKQTPHYLKGSLLDAYVHSPLLQGIADDLNGGPSTLYLPFTAVKSGGGGGQFHFHQDNNYTRWLGPGINLWAALTPMRRNNGALRIVPRSHLGGDVESGNAGDGDGHRAVVRTPGEDEFVTCEMEPGDVVAFTRWTIHGSGPNETAEHRVAYAVQFHRDDVRARIDGEEVLLKENPRYTDIHGVDRIVAASGGKRDGH